MKMIVRILLLISISTQVVAQTDVAGQSDEFKQFARVYLLEKEIAVNNVPDIRALLVEHGVSEERYGEILRARVGNREVALSLAENEMVRAIDELNQAVQIRHKTALTLLCKKHTLDRDRYDELKQQFKTDIRFQRRLKPYFDQLLLENQ